MADITLRQPEPERIVRAADDDALIDLWLERKPMGTRSGYSTDIIEFRDFVRVQLRRLTLNDLFDFAAYLSKREVGEGERRRKLSIGTQQRKLSAVKSLLTFGHKTGYLPLNVGAALDLPKKKNDLANRILTEEDIVRMITLEPNPRNQLLIRLMYVSGGRVSEVVGAAWRDLQERETGGQITLFGKGGKTRAVLLPEKTWRDLQAMRNEASETDPLFISEKGSRLSRSQAWRIVKAAAKRAGVNWDASPHWFRHSHASHAIERGAKLPVVRDTLGHASLSVTNQYIHARPEESSSEHLVIQ